MKGFSVSLDMRRCKIIKSVPKNIPDTDPAAASAKSLQSCPTLCDPIDGGPPGSPVPGILQARTLEWVAIEPGRLQSMGSLRVRHD